MPKDRGGVGVTEDQDRAGGREEPDRAERVEGSGADERPEVCDADRVTTHQRGAGGTRKASGAKGMMVPGEAVRTKSQLTARQT